MRIMLSNPLWVTGGVALTVGETIRKVKEAMNKPIGIRSTQSIEFAFFAPQAEKVYLTGNFNNWNTDSHLMKKENDGTWRTSIRLAPGCYEYKYIVDGDWVQDLPCSKLVQNEFGTFNCVLDIQLHSLENGFNKVRKLWVKSV